jgi:hypothetical protein
VVVAVFSVGVLWQRISSNAQAMREEMSEIRAEQRAIRDELQEILNSLPKP